MWMRGKVGWTPSSRAHLIRWAVMAVELTTLFGCDSTTAPKPKVWDSTWPVWEAPEQAGFSAAGLAEVESYVETLSGGARHHRSEGAMIQTSLLPQ